MHRNSKTRSEAERLLRLVAETTSRSTGEDFFRVLVRSLADALNVRIAFVTECLDYPVTRVRNLAHWRHNEFVENSEWDLEGTPCEIVIAEGKLCHYPALLEQLFIREKGKGVESYLGVPIFNATETRVIGHIALMAVNRIPDNDYIKAVFEIFCSRAGAEIERLHATRTLRELAHLSRLNSMGEMASAFAHEVNQPLCAILSFSQACQRMINNEQIDNKNLRQAIDRIAVNAAQAGNIIKQMRSYVKKEEVEFQPADITQIVQNTLILFETEARYTKIEVEFCCQQPLPEMNVNEIQIQQVLLNLLRNAGDAISMSEGGSKIRIEAGQLSTDNLRICVYDDGPGIPEQLLASVFEPFNSTKKDGIGIGLSICKSIIESHGGTMEAVNNPGRGACFRFSLPSISNVENSA